MFREFVVIALRLGFLPEVGIDSCRALECSSTWSVSAYSDTIVAIMNEVSSTLHNPDLHPARAEELPD